MDDYSTFDVARLFRIDRTRLQEWLKGGYVRPSRKAQGKGTKAVFTRDDMYRLWLFIRLLDVFRSRAVAAEFSNLDFEHVGPGRGRIKYGRWEFSFTEHVLSGKGELLKEAPSGCPVKGGQVVIAIDLASVKAEVDGLLGE
jgi:hypothetical protein